MTATAPPLDQLELYRLCEDPDRWEQLVLAEIERSHTDPVARAILESMYWEADRDGAFERFRQSLDFRSMARLLAMFSVQKHDSICEIGGGSGCLSWALSRAGYIHVSLLEPNPHWITGTGYLRSREDAAAVRVENNLDRWYTDPRKYRVIVTRNCLHHFPNLTWTAACIRQKLELGGSWIMIREPYAAVSRQLYEFWQAHPYSQKYGVFEFAMPPAHYVDALELAGFRASAVVPGKYANDSLSLYQASEGSKVNRLFTRLVDRVLATLPSLTVAAYRMETVVSRLLRRSLGLFSRPQVIAFERVELGTLPANVILYPRNKPSQSRAA
jgi:hypothetical protein